MRHRPWPLILLAALPTLLSTAAFGDEQPANRPGKEKEQHTVRFMRQQEQQAVLLHEEGTEHILIPIGSDTHRAEVFWLFPVPASQNDVAVDIVDEFPILGYDRISSNALHKRQRHHDLIYHCTVQCGLVANPVLGFFFFMAPALSSEETAIMNRPAGQAAQHGLHVETIVALSTESLAAQLAERGVELSDEELAVFESYCSEGFSLVLTRILDDRAVRNEFTSINDSRQSDAEPTHRLALYIRFPTKELWYPMRPRAVRHYCPGRPDIVVLGHVMPKADRMVLRHARYGLARQRSFDPSLLPEPMRTALGPIHTPSYTRLTWMFAPEKDFTGDITFEPMSASAARYELLLEHLFGPWGILTFFVSFAVLLFITGGLCGLIYLREWRRSACYGLLGFLSFPVVSRFTWRDLQRRGIRKRRGLATAYAFTYLALFIALNIAVTFLLLLPLRY